MTDTRQPAPVVRLHPAGRSKPKRSEPVKLTAQRIARMKPRAKPYDVRDAQTPGLIVRVQPSGSASYYVKARIGSGRGATSRNVRIGSVDAVPLQTARTEALRLLAEMRQGIDPTDKSHALTLSQLISAYDDRLRARQVVKRADVVSCLQRNLRRYLNRPALALTRAQIVGVMDAIEAGGHQSDYLRKCASGLLTWAANAGHVPANVLAGYRRDRETRTQKLNTRPKVTLTTPEEIRGFWVATGKLANPVHRDLLRFMLLTGQRRSETACVTRADVVGGVWTIPAALHKMGEAVRVPLGASSLALLDAQPQLAGVGLYFPGRHGKRISGFTQILTPLREALGNPGFGFHALRRTYRTGLEELGVPERVAELMIGHARPDLLGRYSEADLWAQRVEAQARWERHVQEVTQ
ncbi:integrase family protein [Ruegeria sp. B32]|uniref:tyrosine-type recombinase/integrase n=1 Tax=Ruegeria sp. B32 TaxID=2867020 RepID=UPI0021A96EC2|nr:integrase family protein [Ruegeria sp. B32]UWR06561.1 integrase family protein [Ruegeria sp. B32]